MSNNLIRDIQAILPKKVESAESIASKIVNFLDGLHTIDTQLFNEWYETACSKKEALQNKIIIDVDFITEIVKKKWDNKFPELGCNFSFWSGKDDLKVVDISFILGTTSKNKNIGNVVNIEFLFDEKLQLRVNDKRISQIFELMEKCWNPIKVKVE